jgi:FHA domain-containing protein
VGLAQHFERRLEALVEGAFSRASRADLEPLELARKLRREMGAHRRVGLHGEVLVPNHFVAAISPEDHSRYAPIEHAMCTEISELLRTHADEEGWGLMGPVEVELEPDASVRRGRTRLHADYKEAAGPTGGSLILPDGREVVLAGERTVIGRLPECDVALGDPNASRRHAEVRWDGRGYVVSDLGSMNGTLLNEAPVTEARLSPGDVLTIGRTRIEVHLA